MEDYRKGIIFLIGNYEFGVDVVENGSNREGSFLS